MSWSWVVRMLIILVVVLLVVAGTVVALRLTDPGTEEVAEATPAAATEVPSTPTPLVTPMPQLATPTPAPIPTPPPAPSPVPVATAQPAAPALAAGDPCTAELSAAIAAANASQSAFMRGDLEAGQLSNTWGAMAARAQAAAESLLAKSTDAYSVVRISAVVPLVNNCTVQNVSEDQSEVVVETQEVWTYDAVLSCTATDAEQTSRETVTYPGEQYTFVRDGDAWSMQDWNIGVVNIDPAWQCT